VGGKQDDQNHCERIRKRRKTNIVIYGSGSGEEGAMMVRETGSM